MSTGYRVDNDHLKIFMSIDTTEYSLSYFLFCIIEVVFEVGTGHRALRAQRVQSPSEKTPLTTMTCSCQHTECVHYDVCIRLIRI